MLKQRGKKKIWYAILHLGKNRYRWASLDTTSEAEAKIIYASMKDNVRKARHQAKVALLTGQEPPKPKLSVALKDVWTKYKKVNPEPTRFQLMCWNVFADWAEKHSLKAADDVTPQMAIEFLSTYKSAKSFNTYRAGLNAIFKKVELYEIKNPFEALPSRSVTKAPAPKYRAFSIVEMEKLLHAVGETSPWRLAILMGVYTGLRKTDIFHLRWNQIRNNAIDLIPGKTSKHGRAVYIPIHPALKRLIGEKPEGATDSTYVFPVLAEKYNSGTFQRSFDELLTTAQIVDTDKGAASFHSLRATFITIAESIGIDRRIVQGIVGHKSPYMTEHYSEDTESAKVIQNLPLFSAMMANEESTSNSISNT